MRQLTHEFYNRQAARPFWVILITIVVSVYLVAFFGGAFGAVFHPKWFVVTAIGFCVVLCLLYLAYLGGSWQLSIDDIGIQWETPFTPACSYVWKEISAVLVVRRGTGVGRAPVSAGSKPIDDYYLILQDGGGKIFINNTCIGDEPKFTTTIAKHLPIQRKGSDKGDTENVGHKMLDRRKPSD